MDAVDKPEHHSQPGRALAAEDWASVLPEISGDLGLMLCAFAGLRRGEVLGLTWRDVDLAGGVLRIRRQVVRCSGSLLTITPKSAAGCRSVPIVPQLMPALRAAYQLRPDARCVPIAPETLDRRWKRAQERAGISGYRLHDLRHTYATQLVRAGVNFKVLQYVLGHSNISITLDTYSHIDEVAAIAELQRLALH